MTLYYATKNISWKGGFITRNTVVKGVPQEMLEDWIARDLVEQAPVVPEEERPVPEEPPKQVLASSWSFKPNKIKNKSLEQLNVLIKTHISDYGLSDVEPFDDRAEAIAFMTRDRPEGSLVIEESPPKE